MRMLRDRAGGVSLAASVVMAAAGLTLGGAASYLLGRGESGFEAARIPHAPVASTDEAFAGRAGLVAALIAGAAPERLAPPEAKPARPRIIIVFDDIGLSAAAFDEIMTMPGPVTFSFLPYGPDIGPLAARARARGDGIMLHLPMEPTGKADPGPQSLRTDMTASELLAALDWNLGRLENYDAVNNHMGSRLTRDEAVMKTVLSVLAERDVFFLDSLTTGGSVAEKAGRAVGARVYTRDVFLDSVRDKNAIRRQLALVESIAFETGFAIAICHPRRETLDVLGPWLTTAPARGLQLDTVAALPALESAWRARTIAAARPANLRDISVATAGGGGL